MLSAKRHEPRSPFPRLPDAFKARYGVGDLTLRPFGLRETDLEVDFTVRPRPLLVTQILECCTTAAEREKVDPSFFWDLTVGKRIECLLTIATSGGRSGVTLQLRCPNEACGQQSELDISVEELAGLQNPTREAERLPIRRGEERLFIRRPTGSDQLAWLTGRFASEDEAVRSMIRTLISVDEKGAPVADESLLGDEWTARIDQAMEEFDPLINFSLLVSCPYCEEENRYEVDLEELSLGRLRQDQMRLLTTVHRLATHYHWSEQQIFSVPHWRRAHYLVLINKEENR